MMRSRRLILLGAVVASVCPLIFFGLESIIGVQAEKSRLLRVDEELELPPILNNHQCKKNAIVYLAQKHHSSYGRDSYALLQKSLKLLYQNYLTNFHDDTAVFVFHEGDFDRPDLEYLDSQLPIHEGFHFVNLTSTQYWQLPEWLKNDNQTTWRGADHYSVGYRHMMRWYAVKIWDFFHNLNEEQGCQYKYIMRMDEESYIHSSIEYNMFEMMESKDYVYGFRQCSYEMGAVQSVFKQFNKETDYPIQREFTGGGMCGFYNNFFIASLDFFRSSPVQAFLNWVDRKGYMYRNRVNDLVLQTAAVYAFAPEKQIHRFLDFSYEHFTLTKRGCPFWGGIQAGYADPNGTATIDSWIDSHLQKQHCRSKSAQHQNAMRVGEIITEMDLSPTYQHLPAYMNGKLQLRQVAAGQVDVADKGIASG